MTNSTLSALSMNSEIIIDNSLLEIIGKTGIAATLEIARTISNSTNVRDAETGKVSHFHCLQKALQTIYGTQGGAGIAFRVGQVSFKYFLTVFGKKLGFSSADFRLLSMNQRKYKGLTRISEELHEAYGIKSVICDQKSHFLVKIENCPECKGEKSQHSNCHFIVGFLQEYLAWMGGGRFHSVKETTCIAHGDTSCIFELAKNPIGQ